MRKTLPLLLTLSLCCGWLFAETPALTGAMGQSGSSNYVGLTWNATSCASSISTTSTGMELSGPCYGQVYRIAVAAGAACPAFSLSTWTLMTASTPILSTAGAFNDLSIAVGQSYCYAVTDTFQAGGAASALSNTFPVFAIIPGQPGAPTGLSGTTH